MKYCVFTFFTPEKDVCFSSFFCQQLFTTKESADDFSSADTKNSWLMFAYKSTIVYPKFLKLEIDFRAANYEQVP